MKKRDVSIKSEKNRKCKDGVLKCLISTDTDTDADSDKDKENRDVITC